MLFFFSSRRRHTISLRDWSSDVCSSDLGREVDATAYGFLASFDDPAAAIRCADAIRRDVRGLGIEVGAGIHIGECNVRGDDVEGIAVDVAAELDKVARPGEIVVSQAVRDS